MDDDRSHKTKRTGKKIQKVGRLAKLKLNKEMNKKKVQLSP